MLRTSTTRISPGAFRKLQASHLQLRCLSQKLDLKDPDSDRPRRSYLYVPCSEQRMLMKSLETPSDVVIYDLEDSVAPDAKARARSALNTFLNTRHERPLPLPSRVAVRLNAVNTPYFDDDVRAAVSLPLVRTLVLPKIHSVSDLDDVAELVSWASSSSSAHRSQPLRLVASIESARALWDIGKIASWKAHNGPTGGILVSLLFAAEDYCADTSIIRTTSRLELLYTRSQIALAAKAHGLEAIDMETKLESSPLIGWIPVLDQIFKARKKDFAPGVRDECEDGRRLGFTGKQAIHPSQVDIIQRTFVPTEKEIARAAEIVATMEASHREGRGAFGLDLADGSGGREMIDAPMLKQAQNVLRLAKAAGLKIPGKPQVDDDP